eukprot:GHVQ01030538.1.p1 GENE.GHVQ01030538.1~~GHVQ01030538.1.p1  ORF type:complete len:143 (-),score=5.83 GHVQ01030538.1:575-1003(-)
MWGPVSGSGNDIYGSAVEATTGRGSLRHVAVHRTHALSKMTIISAAVDDDYEVVIGHEHRTKQTRWSIRFLIPTPWTQFANGSQDTAISEWRRRNGWGVSQSYTVPAPKLPDVDRKKNVRCRRLTISEGHNTSMYSCPPIKQ